MSLGISYEISAIDKISRVAKKISNKVGKLTDKIKKLGPVSDKAGRKTNKAFRKMGRGASILSGKLKGVAIAGAAFFGLKAIMKNGMQFEDSMAGVSAITKASTKNLKIFEDESKRMSNKFGTSAAQIADGFLMIGSAKSELLDKPMELSKIVEQTVLLSKAGGIDMTTATDVMTKSLNMFGKGAEFAQDFSDIMIQGTVAGAAQMGEFGQSLLNAGGQAQRAGWSFAETTAIIQLMSKSGEVGGRAGSAINTFLAVIAGNKKFKDVDISSGDKLMKFVEKITKMQKEVDGFSIEGEFGLEAARALGVFLAQKKMYQPFQEIIKNRKDATKDAAETRMGTLSERLARARARIDNATLEIFKQLEPFISRMTDKFIKWVDSINDADIETFSKGMERIGSAASMIATIFGKIYNFLDKIATFGGEGVAAVVSGNFDNFTNKTQQKATDKINASGALDIMSSPVRTAFMTAYDMFAGSETDVNINISGNTDKVNSVQSNTTKKTRKSKVKQNMGGDKE